MNRFRFRISTLMAMVLMAAVIFATGRLANDLETPIIMAGGLLVLGMLNTAVLGVIYRRGEQRAFWGGFALFGWPVALVCLLMALGEFEFLLFVPVAVPFGWIGGVVARAFAAGSRQSVGASGQALDAVSFGPWKAEDPAAGHPPIRWPATGESRSPAESQ